MSGFIILRVVDTLVKKMKAKWKKKKSKVRIEDMPAVEPDWALRNICIVRSETIELADFDDLKDDDAEYVDLVILDWHNVPILRSECVVQACCDKHDVLVAGMGFVAEHLSVRCPQAL